MLSLDSSKWSDLRHAYGHASDIPDLLRQLEEFPSSDGQNEPWHSIWSALAHQGDIYTASFAAIPHVIRILKQAPAKADYSYFHFPAWVEVCRQKNSVEIPKELESAYFSALAELPSLVAAASCRTWDYDFLCCALSAIAAAKGFGSVAEAVLEFDPEVTEEFLEWIFNQQN